MVRKNLPSYNTKEDRKIISLFKEEMDRINLLYLKAIQSKDMTKANQLYKQIQNISKTLINEYGERADVKLSTEYLKGAGYINSVEGSGETFSVPLSKKEIKAGLNELGPVHIEAVNALLNNSKNYVRSSLDGMERQALTMITEIQQEKVREELAKGIISGEDIFSMKKRVEQYFIENDITTFHDKGNHSRTMDRYIDMLTRTETSIANIQGAINRAVQLGITKFRIIESPDCCNECSELNGTIVDVKDGTVELPPFHPNCRGYIVSVDDDWEKMSPRKDEPRKNLKLPDEITYKYLEDDINAVKKKRDGNFSIGLVDESIIRNYTGDDYTGLNNGKPEWVANELNKTILRHIDYKGTTHRGLHLSQEEYDEMINNGIYDSRGGFTSTSVNEEVAKGFASAGLETDVKVILHVHHKGGMNITKYSRFDEREVLLSRGKTLKLDVENLKKGTKYIYIDAYE